MVTGSIEITAYDTRVFRCRDWVIECGPGSRWAILDRPNDARQLNLEDLQALALISHAARLWLEANPDGPVARA